MTSLKNDVNLDGI